MAYDKSTDDEIDQLIDKLDNVDNIVHECQVGTVTLPQTITIILLITIIGMII